jgi:hypothetical protein
MYEAKILELRLSDPEDRRSPYEYRVHYKGWKNTYVLRCPCLWIAKSCVVLRLPEANWDSETDGMIGSSRTGCERPRMTTGF